MIYRTARKTEQVSRDYNVQFDSRMIVDDQKPQLGTRLEIARELKVCEDCQYVLNNKLRRLVKAKETALMEMGYKSLSVPDSL